MKIVVQKFGDKIQLYKGSVDKGWVARINPDGELEFGGKIPADLVDEFLAAIEANKIKPKYEVTVTVTLNYDPTGELLTTWVEPEYVKKVYK